ncbi:MAG: MarR family transcriptional regulator [Mycolicibacterium sp.]|jgi:hypothetical protein|nr:MarR family transcriptional regulator [Mycobacterium sp.]MCB9416147.1 MarR family transcriptional regulator [Mycolicibacterium sp.]
MVELKVLQAVRLKGEVSPADLAATVDEDAASVAQAIAAGTEAGLLSPAGRKLKLSPDGRSRLEWLLQQERSGIDRASMASAYEEFRSANADFKIVVSDWTLRDGEPNTHQDADYDAEVLARLEHVHARVRAVIDTAGQQIPRLRGYADKLEAALGKIRSGDTVWLSEPVVDSYHTAWFELHEELLIAADVTPAHEG